MRTLFPLASLTLAAAVSAQSPLDTFALTTFTATTSNGTDNGVYFDLDFPNFPALITDINKATSSSTSGAIEIWTCVGSHTAVDPVTGLAPTGDPTVWTLQATAPTVTTGAGSTTVATDYAFATPFLVPQGVTGFYVKHTGGQTNSYASTSPLPVTLQVPNGDCIFTTGSSGSGGPGTGGLITPRLFMGDISYLPGAGLFPSFTQDVASGPSPLTVNFTDTSFTDDPAGVSVVEFDFTNDGTFDIATTAGSTVTNVYGCGTYDVALRATDTINGQATNVVSGAVIADEVTAAFTQDQTLVGTGQTVNFSATVTPGATLAWDLDGDGIIDDVNPVTTFTYNTPGTFNISLTATLACNTVTETSTIDVVTGAVFSPGLAGGFTTFTTPPDASYFDVNVTNPAGYLVQEIFHRTRDVNQPHLMEIYVQTVAGQSVVGFEAASNFTLISSGTAVAPATANELFRVDVADFTLPPGITGMAIVSRNPESGHTWYIGNSGLTASNADITITPHSSSTNFDTQSNGATSTNSWAGGFVGTAVNDLFPGFTTDVTAGLSPLTVNFTDQSVTNDPVGVLSWAWDFQDDGTDDDFTQNPTFTYTSCGDFSVKLTVIDSVNGSRSLTKPNLIETDLFSASFTQSATFAGTASPVNFTYTGDPAALVTWDFDNNGTTDAVGPTASFTFPAAGTYTTSMTATLNCRQETATSSIDIIAGDVITAQPGPAGTITGFTSPPDASYIDLQVANLGGVTITELLFRSVNTTAVVTYEIWGQLNQSVVGNYDSANFTLLSSGTAQATVPDELFLVDVTDFSLPIGTHGLAVVTRSSPSSHRWYTGNQGISSTVGDLTLTPQGSYTTFTSATNTNVNSNGFSGGFVFSSGGAAPPPGTVAKLADGCPGSLGQSDVQQGINPPAIGTTYAVRVTNVQAGVQLHGGISNSFNATFGVPLPLDLAPIFGTQASCRFYTSSEIIFVAIPNGFGEAVVSFPIPNNPAFQGLVVFYQGVIFDAAVPGNIAVSNAYFAVVQ